VNIRASGPTAPPVATFRSGPTNRRSALILIQTPVRGPSPSLPAEETPANPASTAVPAAADGNAGADPIAAFGALFGLHPDVKDVAYATKAKTTMREFELGEALYKAGRYADALQHFEKSYATIPTPENLYNRAKCLEHLGQHEAAAKLYDDYVAADPKADDAGSVHAHALDLHAQALNLARTAYDRGLTAYGEGRFADAAVAFRDSRDHVASPDATFMVAKSLDLAGDSTAATVHEYQRYLNEAPDAQDAGTVRARIHALQEATGSALMEP
jgi:tetratricopeptide (TPR) repeat protein